MLATLLTVALLTMSNYKVCSFSKASVRPSIGAVSMRCFRGGTLEIGPDLSSSLASTLVSRCHGFADLSVVSRSKSVGIFKRVAKCSAGPVTIATSRMTSRGQLAVAIGVCFAGELRPRRSFRGSFSTCTSCSSARLLSTIRDSLYRRVVRVLVRSVCGTAITG